MMLFLTDLPIITGETDPGRAEQPQLSPGSWEKPHGWESVLRP